MSFETRGVERDGRVVLDAPIEEGTSVRVITPDEPSFAEPSTPTWKHKKTNEMDERERREWLDLIVGSCPDMEEPPDLPLQPLRDNEIWSD